MSVVEEIIRKERERSQRVLDLKEILLELSDEDRRDLLFKTFAQMPIDQRHSLLAAMINMVERSAKLDEPKTSKPSTKEVAAPTTKKALVRSPKKKMTHRDAICVVLSSVNRPMTTAEIVAAVLKINPSFHEGSLKAEVGRMRGDSLLHVTSHTVRGGMHVLTDTARAGGSYSNGAAT